MRSILHSWRYVSVLAVLLTIFLLQPAAAVQALAKDSAEWLHIEKAAKGEALNLMAMTGTSYAGVVAAFQKAYPDIKVNMNQARPGDSTARIVTEQKNGQYFWDVFWGPPNSLSATMVPVGAVQDIRPFFLLSSVTDDKNWMGRFQQYSQDITKRSFSFLAQMTVGVGGFAVNLDRVPKDSPKEWKDLLDPKWRGKMVIYEPTRPITGAIHLACALPVVGEDFVRKLLRDQQLVANGDSRLITDWIVRGRYPIVIGLSASHLPKYQEQGLGKNVVEEGDTVCRGIGGPALAVMKNAPNTNATKVFMNWLLSKEGQEIYTKFFWPYDQTFSRRTDVALPDDARARFAIEQFKSGKSIATGSETHVNLINQVLKISREYFK